MTDISALLLVEEWQGFLLIELVLSDECHNDHTPSACSLVVMVLDYTIEKVQKIKVITVLNLNI